MLEICGRARNLSALPALKLTPFSDKGDGGVREDSEVPLPWVQWPFLLSSKPSLATKSTAATGLTRAGHKNEMF